VKEGGGKSPAGRGPQKNSFFRLMGIHRRKGSRRRIKEEKVKQKKLLLRRIGKEIRSSELQFGGHIPSSERGPPRVQRKIVCRRPTRTSGNENARKNGGAGRKKRTFWKRRADTAAQPYTPKWGGGDQGHREELLGEGGPGGIEGASMAKKGWKFLSI